MYTSIVLVLMLQCTVLTDAGGRNGRFRRSMQIQGHMIASVGSSSIYESTVEPKGPFRPWYAVDGVAETNIWKQGCFHSSSHDPSPWWMVKFLESYKIKQIVITNRQDCCADRLADLDVYVGGTLCASFKGPFTGPELTIDCTKTIEGSDVRIERRGRDLTLCEVEFILE